MPACSSGTLSIVLPGSKPGTCRYGTLWTELPTDYHSIIELSVCGCVWKLREGYPDQVWPKSLKWEVFCIPVWRSTSMDSTTTGRPCVWIPWRVGVSCPESVEWHSCVTAHWSKYHCYKQAPSRYDLRCLKAMLNFNPNRQTNVLPHWNTIIRHSTWVPTSSCHSIQTPGGPGVVLLLQNFLLWYLGVQPWLRNPFLTFHTESEHSTSKLYCGGIQWEAKWKVYPILQVANSGPVACKSITLSAGSQLLPFIDGSIYKQPSYAVREGGSCQLKSIIFDLLKALILARHRTVLWLCIVSFSCI